MKAILLVLALAAALAAVARGQQQVVVIGAGMAGISAGRALYDKGISSIILEAQPRVGGRLKTDRSKGFPVDLGASWIHGPVGNAKTGPNPLTALADKFNLKRAKTDNNSLRRYKFNGTEFTDAEQEKTDADFAAMLALVRADRKADLGKNDVSLQDYLVRKAEATYNTAAGQWRINSDTEFQYGAPAAEMSALGFDSDSAFRGADVLFPKGYDRMINATNLAKNLDIRTGVAVTAIDYTNPKAIRVTTSDGQVITTGGVICTVPLGVLKANRIAFTPALPAPFQNAMAKLKMGTTNKLAVVFPSVFWDTKTVWFGVERTADGSPSPAERGKFNTFINLVPGFNVSGLMTFMLGQYGLDVEQQSEADVRADLMRSVRTIWPNAPEPQKIVYSKWTSDPYTGGAYAYCPVGCTWDDFDTLSGPLNEDVPIGLYFAGEHTSAKYRGTVHGAYLSGIGAANKLSGLTSVDWSTYKISPLSFANAAGKIVVTFNATNNLHKTNFRRTEIRNAVASLLGTSWSALSFEAERDHEAKITMVSVSAPMATKEAGDAALNAAMARRDAFASLLTSSGVKVIPETINANGFENRPPTAA